MRVGAALGLLCSVPLIAADWVRLKTPEIEVLTDAGEKAGRETLARLSQVRGNFSIPTGNPLNLRVFLFASEREFRGYTDSPATDGFFQSGPERDSIVLHSGTALGRVVVHEYIHLLLDHGTSPLPLWLEEGLAEFYSTMEPRGKRLVIGTPIAEHQQTLAREKWLSPDEFFSAGKRSSLYDERRRAGVFYAQSWALVHMLNLAPDYRDGMGRFAELLASGVANAFPAAFRRTAEQALGDLKSYASRAVPVTVDGSPAITSGDVHLERLSALDAALARGELALRTGHPQLGRRLYEQAAREHPDHPAAEAGLGMLAIAQGDRAGAREHLEKAIALGPAEAATWFEYAMFEREEGAAPARVDELLRKAVEINPNLAEARFVLGVRLTDDGRLEEAVGHLREAVRVQPRQSSFWHALGFALGRLGQRDEAMAAAQRAVRTAASPEEESMSQSLVLGLGEP